MREGGQLALERREKRSVRSVQSTARPMYLFAEDQRGGRNRNRHPGQVEQLRSERASFTLPSFRRLWRECKVRKGQCVERLSRRHERGDRVEQAGDRREKNLRRGCSAGRAGAVEGD